MSRMRQTARWIVQRVVKTSVLATVSAILLANAGRAEEIQWLRSAEQAGEVAAQSGKPILVYIRSANCHYCDLMQTNVWQDPATVAIVRRDFVPLKLTQEENPEAVQVLQVKGFPTTVIFSADRRYVDRLDGYVEAERFRIAVGKIHADVRR